MPIVVLRNVPDDLYGRLKQAVTDHRRSPAQEAIVALQSGLDLLLKGNDFSEADVRVATYPIR